MSARPSRDDTVADRADPVLEVKGATLAFGDRRLWDGLDLTVRPGEFIAVLGGNGSGKTTLLRALLGLVPLSAGQISVAGRPVRRGSPAVGYIPQQRRVDQLTPMRAKDMVRLGVDGHRWGIARPGRVGWTAVHDALDAVGAAAIADVPFGLLSGGEQQRVRVAQALVVPRRLLLCDEPLLSLDPVAQTAITSLIASACHPQSGHPQFGHPQSGHERPGHEQPSAALFVTHEITPVVANVDRVLYLAGGRFRIGTVDEVLTSSSLSDLYGVPVEVLERDGNVVVAGAPGDPHDLHGDHS